MWRILKVKAMRGLAVSCGGVLVWSLMSVCSDRDRVSVCVCVVCVSVYVFVSRCSRKYYKWMMLKVKSTSEPSVPFACFVCIRSGSSIHTGVRASRRVCGVRRCVSECVCPVCARMCVCVYCVCLTSNNKDVPSETVTVTLRGVKDCEVN